MGSEMCIRDRPKLQPGMKNDAEKIYQCTFCTDAFHIKYDWVRHEKTMHLSLEKWVCQPIGPVTTVDALGNTTCSYCQHPNPDRDHLDEHGHDECGDRDIIHRTFYRKDHLRQHLRLTHQVPFGPWMEDWKIAPATVRSRCGFCCLHSVEFTTWQERADHLAKHFREGARMKDWSGNHGFDPEIAAQVTDAMPPFMIDHERMTPDPFSASKGHRGVWTTDVIATEAQGLNAHHEAMLDGRPAPKVRNCWTILTKELGQLVQQQLAMGIVPTDAMLQSQARYTLFGEDDSWDQTAADNQEWLDLFKRAHGLLESSDNGKGKTTAHATGTGQQEVQHRQDSGVGESPADDSLMPQLQQDMFMDDEMFDLTLNNEDQEFHRLFQQAGLTNGDS